MEKFNVYSETSEDPTNWLYCEDESQNKYVFYRGHPAFLAKFTGKDQCTIEGMEQRFSFSDPFCKTLIEIAGQKGKIRFGLVNPPNVNE